MPWFLLISAVLSAYIARDKAQQQTQAVEQAARLREQDRRRQEEETLRANAADMNAQARQAMADMALFDTAVGEFGGGRTADRGRAVMRVQQGESAATLANNSRLGLRQLGFQGLANQANTDSQLASIDRPSVLGTVLQLGSAYVQDTRYQAATKKPTN